jgi:hypothetical protein
MPTYKLKKKHTFLSGTIKTLYDMSQHVVDPDAEHWAPHRTYLHHVLKSAKADLTLGRLIMINVVLLVLETDAVASGEESYLWVRACEVVITLIYFTEVSLRIYVYRVEFFLSGRDLLDASIVACDLIIFAMATMTGSKLNFNPTLFRIVRLTRLGKVVRLLVLFPELHLILAGLWCAFKAIIWGMLLMFFWLVIVAIMAVQFLNPVNEEVAAEGIYEGCERCPRAWSSVSNSMLTFTQTLLFGDSWGLTAIPIIEHAPWTYGFFLMVFVTVCVAAMNLILAAIVDAAQDAKAQGDHEIARVKQQEQQHASGQLLELCKSLDYDGSGTLNVEELREGMTNNPEFGDAMKAMDISSDDIDVVFGMLDEDRSGDVDYEEFIAQVHKMKTNDTHTLLIFIRHYVKAIHDQGLSDMKVALSSVYEKLEDVHKDLTAVHQSVHMGPVASESNVPVPPPVSSSDASTLPPPPQLEVRSSLDVQNEQSRINLGPSSEGPWQIGGASGTEEKNRPSASPGEPSINPMMEAERKQLHARLEGFKDAMRLMDDKLARLDLEVLPKGSEEKARNPNFNMSRAEDRSAWSSRGASSAGPGATWAAARCCSAPTVSQPEQISEPQAAPNRLRS